MKVRIPQGDDIRYTETHEWARQEGERIITVGITEYAVKELGDIVYIELPEVETEIEAKETFGTIESVKAVSDLISPVTGRIIQVNESIAEAPEELADDPYEEGWLIKIEVEDPSEFEDLMTAEEYIEYISQEASEPIEIEEEEE